MVVVDNARKMIGKTIDVSVTSVLQTTAGKMIFGKWDERAAYSRQPSSCVADFTNCTSGIHRDDPSRHTGRRRDKNHAVIVTNHLHELA